MKKLSKDGLRDWLDSFFGEWKACSKSLLYKKGLAEQAYSQLCQLIEAQEPSEKELEEFVEVWALAWGHFSDRQKKIVTEYIVRLLDAYDKLRRG